MTVSTGKQKFGHLKNESFEVRLWARIEKDGPGGCWLWIGAKRRDGYGFLWDKLEQKQKTAHRIVFELLKGPIPEGMSLDHRCRVRGCVNPAHLEVVTHTENVRRGVSPAAMQRLQTHCKRGHPFDAENTYVQPNGGRACRTCARERQIARRELTRTHAQVDSSVKSVQK